MIDFLKGSSCRVTSGEEYGTGFLVAKGTVLTARHCVLPAIESGQPISLKFSLITGDLSAAAEILGHSEEFDACLVRFEQPFEAPAIPLQAPKPREGSEWRSFGFPAGKFEIGHRVTGRIDHVLASPKARIDLDVTVDLDTAIANYRGYSGGAVEVDGAAVGMLRYRSAGTLGAITIHALAEFLKAHGVAPLEEPRRRGLPALADRGAFLRPFEEIIRKNPGCYLFLQGGHGLGKTTFCSTFQPSDPSLLPFGSYCLYLPGDSLSVIYRAQPEVFFDWLLTTATYLITGQGARKENRPYTQMAKDTERILHQISEYARSRSQQVIIFIDGLNEARDADPTLLTNLIGLLPATLPACVAVILTAPNFSLVAQQLDGRVKAEHVLNLPPLSFPASAKYCQARLASERVTPALVRRICDKAAGHPLYLHYIIEYANAQPADEALDNFPVLTGPIEDYYQTIWAKLAQDADSVRLIALFARLRWGIAVPLFVKALSGAEQAVLTVTLAKIRHLLAEDGNTTVYHQSFAAFAVGQTRLDEEPSHDRLANLCRLEADSRYGRLNLVYHLCRASASERGAAIAACDQAWVDAAVSLSAEPEELLVDIEKVLGLAIERGPAAEFFRVLLLLQRVQFRYNVLFAQSAALMAEALIALARPHAALTYLIRFKSLIVGAEETLVVAHSLARAGFGDEALDLLSRFQDRLEDSYQGPLKLSEFLHYCTLHVQAIFMVRFAGGPGGMKDFFRIVKAAEEACSNALHDDQQMVDAVMAPIRCLSNSYFLTFRDCYTDLASLKPMLKGRPLSPAMLSLLCRALIQFETWVDRYSLSKRRSTLAAKFQDFAELLALGQPMEAEIVPLVVDSLVRFGAPASLIQSMMARTAKGPAPDLTLRAQNGVNVDFSNLTEVMNSLRTTAFLEATPTPEAANFGTTTWFESFGQLARALFWCDGRARRAKADGDSASLAKCFSHLQAVVLDVLLPTLARRVAWKDAYAIPEQLMPYFHRQVIELLVDCFPEHLPEHLGGLLSAAPDQWGMYTEGFREAIYCVMRELSREERPEPVNILAIKLLAVWREHVLRGVENRRELVPDILRLIPLHAAFGATEEAERLYTRMLAVSMGPSWYKEGQFGLMTDTLKHMPAGDNVLGALQRIAGYLERASGEMTFQRYVRAGKSDLIGELARRDLLSAAFAYFQRQTCGNPEQLMAESRTGIIDKPSPEKGGRFPGGALEEQDSILSLVRQAKLVDWRIRWAVLEVYVCGDSRHTADYAEEFAALANEAAIRIDQIPSLVRRLETVAIAETSAELQRKFLRHFNVKLLPAYRPHFAHVSTDPQAAQAPDPGDEAEERPVPRQSDKVADQSDDFLFMPGVFGRQSAMKLAPSQLSAAQAQLDLGNRQAAKELAAALLAFLQKAEWNIWSDNLSEEHRKAEAIIRDGESDAINVIRHYGPMVLAEKNTALWMIAGHLIVQVAGRMSELERHQLLMEVIEHIRHMVGNADPEIADHEFLATAVAAENGDREMLRFLFWLIDHPVDLRRQRAATLIAWLIDEIADLPALMAPIAFSNQLGFTGDVLATLLDHVSSRDPAATWERLLPALDLDAFLRGGAHAARVAMLLKIATRAEAAGSDSARVAAAEIDRALAARRDRPCPPDRAPLPPWAQRIRPTWEALEEIRLAGPDVLAAFHREIGMICAPFSVDEIWALEGAVSDGFREYREKTHNRWEARVRTALNLALSTFVGRDQLEQVEALSRVSNPSLPDIFLRPGRNKFMTRLLAALVKMDFTGTFVDADHILLNLHAGYLDPQNVRRFVEIVAFQVVSSLRHRALFPPKLLSSFGSSQPPELAPDGGPQETCSRLVLESVYFGQFTPSLPLPQFVKQTGASASDFLRQTWRYARRHQLRHFGVPVEEGCMLAIRAPALKLPPGKKLAWTIWTNGNCRGMFDEQGNQLL